MIVADSSAIIAIMFDEAGAPACMVALRENGARLVSAANYVEAGTVMAGRIRSGDRREAVADLDAFLVNSRMDLAPVDDRLARAAVQAWIDFSQGFGTRGGLNFGDCFACALARQHSAPLLYVGNGFLLTGIQSALAA